MFPFPNRDASVHRDWPADVRYVAAKDGARIAEKGELGVALGNDQPLAFIRVQILVKTTVNDKRQKARIPATKLQWLPARHAILTSGSGRTLDGRESLRAGRDAQLLPCRPADRYPGPNAHTGPDGWTSVNQPLALYAPQAHVVQYADDTQVLVSGKKDSLPQLIATMEQALSSLGAWFHSHGLKVNTGKTELIVCGSRQNCRGMRPTSNFYSVPRGHSA